MFFKCGIKKIQDFISCFPAVPGKSPHARDENNEDLSGISFDFFKTISGYEVEKLRIYAIVVHCSGFSC